MKFLKALCVLALALCLTASVYAETQSVKVSGDLTMRGIFRDQYDYQGNPSKQEYEFPAAPGANIARTGIGGPQQSWIMSVAEIEVDADLTDNVQTVIRLTNQRDWDVNGKNISVDTPEFPNGMGGYTKNGSEFNVLVNLAYVTLKDFVYAPLTVTIGRQNLWFGKGFIVGANQQNPDNTLSAPEYTAINSFDAVKGVLDYDPWTITAIYSKIQENAIQDDDDVNLWGVNVGYKFDAYKAEAEGYWFWKQDRSQPNWNGIKDTSNDVHTFGLRGSFDPIDVVTVGLEGAWQGGQYVNNRYQLDVMPRSAWALDASAELRYFTSKFAWKPKLGAEYILYSGQKEISNGVNMSGTYTGWDMMYRGKFDSAIREFVGRYYGSARYGANPYTTQSYPDASYTNQSQMIFMGSVQPMDSITLKANYNLFWNLYQYQANSREGGQSKSGGYVGQELDLSANWDYTEDVSFGILAGWFVPGDVYTDHLHDIATDVVGTVKVSF